MEAGLLGEYGAGKLDWSSPCGITSLSEEAVKETRTIPRAGAMHRRGFRSNGNAGNKKNAYLGLKASAAASCSSRIGGETPVARATRRNMLEAFDCTSLIHRHLEMF
ncbi:hypothetical protein BDFB_005537 [Asbolus verrucosus]|uniref:Uncharacterized protein n=1 Tax=Asbolus verrucosus TaxID=1661398 RepID=A0A482VHQ6_ASBVE|nr:hypothetical protein BDFB_005537 [Asbolus verrucosus]